MGGPAFGEAALFRPWTPRCPAGWKSPGKEGLFGNGVLAGGGPIASGGGDEQARYLGASMERLLVSDLSGGPHLIGSSTPIQLASPGRVRKARSR